MELVVQGAQVVARDPFAGNGWFLRQRQCRRLRRRHGGERASGREPDAQHRGDGARVAFLLPHFKHHIGRSRREPER